MSLMSFRVMPFLVALYGLISLVCHFTSGTLNETDSLILENGDSLKINTTDGSIVVEQSNGTLNKTYHDIGSTVTNITFDGEIYFGNGSRVDVFGKNALRMKSRTKNIVVQTDINMTCKEKRFNSTCLGGSTQSLSSQENVTHTNTYPEETFPLYLGLGKGGPQFCEQITRVVHTPTCIPGSSHGGNSSSNPYIFKQSLSYGINSTSPLLGGSAGSCVNFTGSVAGGGAIELIAEQGNITIGAFIRASAQQDFSGVRKLCSGGSGGHIRLKARKVRIIDRGKLIVDGGDPVGDETFFAKGGAGGGAGGVVGGGAGGVIQIIASEVSLPVDSLSLKHGTVKGTCKAQDGYFLFKHNETMAAVVSATGNFRQFPPQSPFVWPPAAPNTAATTTSTPSDSATPSDSTYPPSTHVPSTEERGQSLLNQTRNIRISLWAGNKVNATAISEVLTKHKTLTANVTLNKETLLELCLAMFEEYKVIVSQIADTDLVEKVIQESLIVATNCLGDKNYKMWRQTREMPNLVDSLEQVFVGAVQRNISSIANLALNTEKVAVQVRQSSVEDATDLTLPDYSEINGAAWNGVSDSIFIPKQLLQAEGNYTYVVLLYKDVESLLPVEHASLRGLEKVSSLVMSCSLIFEKSIVIDKLAQPVTLTFYSLNTEGRERSCSYWNVIKSAWASDGVTLQQSESNSDRTVCKTDHLTSFAVLVQHKEVPIPEKDQLALSIITYIGCGISTVALVITIIIFLSIESLSTDRHKIHTNLALALLFAQVLFLSGITETSSKILCTIIAVFLHYFFLTAFTWMLVEGVHLYLKVVQVFRTENFRMAYYYGFGWCLPAIPVGVTVSMKPESYGNENVCWLSMKDGTVWAFIGPVVAIIAINCFILFMVVKTVVSSASAVKSTSHSNDHVKAGVKGLLVLMPILGVTWLLGLFYVDRNTLFFQYAFAICNAFQGLLIFLLHCVFNGEVRQAFRRQQEKRALSKESGYSQYNASFSETEYTSRKERSSNGFEKLKARLSLRLLSGSKVIQVQPLSENRDCDVISLQVKRTYEKNASKCSAAADHESGLSSLNCPMENKDRVPPKETSLVSQHSQQAAVRRQQRP